MSEPAVALVPQDDEPADVALDDADRAAEAESGALAVPMTGPVDARLDLERKLAWLPASVAVADTGVDTMLHQMLMQAGHMPLLLAPVALGFGAIINGTAALVSGWTLARHAALEKCDHEGKLVPISLARVFAAEAASGAVLSLLGVAPLTLTARAATVAAGTVGWHKARRRARRTLRETRAQLQLPPPPPPPLALPAAVEPDDDPVLPDVAEIELRWRTGVTPGSTALAKSTLLDGFRHDNGRLVFTVDRAGQGLILSAAQAARESIAGTLQLKLPDESGTGGQDVVFDQPLGAGLHRGQLRMQVIDLAVSGARSERVTPTLVSAPGNRYSVRIGCYIDDGTPAFWDFADSKGVWSGMVIGGTGLGKSSLVDLLAYRARQLGFHVGFLDPQSGASSQVMVANATYVALGVDQAGNVLNFLEDQAAYREKWLELHRVGKILPGMLAPCGARGAAPDPDCPCGHVVPPPQIFFIEECDQIFGALVPNAGVLRYAEPYGQLAKRIRKLGMGFIALSQLSDQKMFGGSELLRSSLSIRNLLAMFIKSGISGNLIPGLPYSPHLLPMIAGRALVCGEASRKMEVMLDWLPRREDAEVAGGDGAFAEDLFAQQPPVVPFIVDKMAAQRWLPGAEDAAEASRTRAGEHIRRMLDGHSPTLAGAVATAVRDREAASGAAAVPVGSTQFAWPTAVAISKQPPSEAERAAIRAVALGLTQVEDGEDGEQDDAQTARATIWRLLTDPHDPVYAKGELIDRSGYSESMVRKALNKLLTEGKVRNDEHGIWQPVEVQ